MRTDLVERSTRIVEKKTTIRFVDCFTSFAMTRTYRNVIASKAKQSNDDPIRQLIQSMLFYPAILNGQTTSQLDESARWAGCFARLM